MADWKSRAKISVDVVFFPYVTPEKEEKIKEIYLWDIDKTYLDTRFETLGGLWQTLVEKAFQKRNVPGTSSLVGALKQQHQQENSKRIASEEKQLPIYFITASPPQMEKKIHEKMILDEIKPFGIFFKDNLKNLHPRRWWRLTQQVGYKLQALLILRSRLPSDVRFVMWGDDSEADAVIYSLFSDICARRRGGDELMSVLRSFYVLGEQLESILYLQSQVPEGDPVEKIYINLAEDTDADYYLKFGRRTLPIYSSFQSAVDLFQDGRLSSELVLQVAKDLVTNFDYTTEELERHLDDLVRRQRLGIETLQFLLPVLQNDHLIHKNWEPSILPKPIAEKMDERVVSLEGSYEPWIPEHIDYLHDYR